MKRFLLAPIFAIGCASSMGQTVATKFPAEASTPSAEGLKENLSGRVDALDRVGATPWRMEFNANGYVFSNAGSSSGSGTWRSKRLSGEVTAMIPK